MQKLFDKLAKAEHETRQSLLKEQLRLEGLIVHHRAQLTEFAQAYADGLMRFPAFKNRIGVLAGIHSDAVDILSEDIKADLIREFKHRDIALSESIARIHHDLSCNITPDQYSCPAAYVDGESKILAESYADFVHDVEWTLESRIAARRGKVFDFVKQTNLAILPPYFVVVTSRLCKRDGKVVRQDESLEHAVWQDQCQVLPHMPEWVGDEYFSDLPALSQGDYVPSSNEVDSLFKGTPRIQIGENLPLSIKYTFCKAYEVREASLVYRAERSLTQYLRFDVMELIQERRAALQHSPQAGLRDA